MKHKVWFDEDAGILRMELKGLFTAEDAPEFFSLVDKLYKDKPHRNVLCDLSEGSAVVPKDKEYRKWLMKMYNDSNFEKIAITNIHPTLRILVKVIVAAIGKTGQMKFFKTEEEALAWLDAK